MLVSRSGEVLWRYDHERVGLTFSTQARFSLDGSTVYASAVHEDGSAGHWALSPQRGEPTLVVAYDRFDINGVSRFSVGPDRLYVTVQETESDIWVMDVEVER
jgi:hypothetical protein